MSQAPFNKNATEKLPPIRAYYIEAAVAPHADPFAQMNAVGNLKNGLQNWVAAKTGVMPALEIIPPASAEENEKISIMCSEAFINEVKKAFPTKIAKITKIPTREDLIAEDIQNGGNGGICWRPPGL